MKYPKIVWNKDGEKFTFIDEFENSIAKYLDSDGETVVYLTNFNGKTCFEMFDGKITKEQYKY